MRTGLFLRNIVLLWAVLSLPGCASRSEQEGVFRNGLKFILLDRPSAITSAVFLIGCGTSDGEPGLTDLTAEYLLHGNSVRTAGQIYEEIERLGGTIGTETSLTHMLIFVEAPSQNFAECFEILSECVTLPAFDEDPETISILRKKRVFSTMGFDKPFWDDSAVRSMLFEGSDLGKPVPQVPPAFSKEQVLGHYKKFFRPSNTILAICGRVNKKRVMKALVSNWNITEKSSDSLPGRSTGSLSGTRRKIQNTGQPGDRILMGFRAPRALTPEGYATGVLEFLLTDGRAAILNRALKEKGWGDRYCHCYYYDGAVEGYLIIVLDMPDGRSEEGVEFLSSELGKLRDHVPEEVFQIAKRKLRTRFYSSIQFSVRTAYLFAFAEYAGAADFSVEAVADGLKAVTREKVQEAVQKLDSPVIVILK